MQGGLDRGRSKGLCPTDAHRSLEGRALVMGRPRTNRYFWWSPGTEPHLWRHRSRGSLICILLIELQTAMICRYVLKSWRWSNGKRWEPHSVPRRMFAVCLKFKIKSVLFFVAREVISWGTMYLNSGIQSDIMVGNLFLLTLEMWYYSEFRFFSFLLTTERRAVSEPN